MKTFMIYLRDGRIAIAHADTYRHEGNQYVFDKVGSSEVQFFIDSEVVGISEAAHPQLTNAVPPGEGKFSLLSEAEQEIVLRTLAECGGNRTETARKLGISRRGLAYKFKRIPSGLLPR